MDQEESIDDLRGQLIAAISNVRRQLEILNGPAAGNRSHWGDTRSVSGDLESELAQLERALSDLNHA
jgi:hypothetical protein